MCKSKVKHEPKKHFNFNKNVHYVTGQNEFFVDSLETDDDKPEEWRATLKTSGSHVNYKLDTGSQVNILLKHQYQSLRKKPRLHKTQIKLKSYSKHGIPVLGACVLDVERHGKTAKVFFVVVKDATTAILGVKACDRLGLVKRVYTISEGVKDPDSLENTIGQNSDLFEGLGCLPGEHKITVDKSVTPVITPCRKIPFALHDKLRDELKRMEDMDVICKETEHTEWVSPIVIVPEKDGNIRVCLDPMQINKAIKREHYKRPTRDEIHAKFKDGRYFSKLDARTGFLQMKLDHDSSKLTCFNTPFGSLAFRQPRKSTIVRFT